MAKTQNFQRSTTLSSTVVYRNINPCICTNLNNIVFIKISMTFPENYYVNCVVQISTSTGVYIYVNYLLSFTSLEILCFGPVKPVNNE